MVTSDFADDPNPWFFHNPNLVDNATATGYWEPDGVLAARFDKMRTDITSLNHLNKSQCIEQYIGSASGAKDVIVVAANVTMSNATVAPSMIDNNPNKTSLLDVYRTEAFNSWPLVNSWICMEWWTAVDIPSIACTEDFIRHHIENWTWVSFNYTDGWVQAETYEIAYCLSDGNESAVMDEKCALRFSPPILIVVCILNLLKCLAIGYTISLNRHPGQSELGKKEPPDKTKYSGILREWCKKVQYPRNGHYTAESLVTIGDMVQSCLEHNDVNTEDIGVVQACDFRRGWPKQHDGRPLRKPREVRWLQTLSVWTWASTYLW